MYRYWSMQNRIRTRSDPTRKANDGAVSSLMVATALAAMFALR
jgi:hypothetical protein